MKSNRRLFLGNVVNLGAAVVACASQQKPAIDLASVSPEGGDRLDVTVFMDGKALARTLYRGRLIARAEGYPW